MKKSICFLLLINLLAGCLAKKQAAGDQQAFPPSDTLTLFDPSRGRKIPVAVYKTTVKHPRLVIFSHGYGMNRGDSYLASKGYFVVSIQHELPTDS
jgi:predicted dienelactone hydrolase